MRTIDLGLESTKQRQATCLGLAIGLHALLLIWNPVMLRSDWKPAHDFVTIDVVDLPQPGGYTQPEAPKKSSILDALKQMVSNPKDAMQHVSPQPQVPQVAAPTRPMLSEKSRPQPITSAFTPKTPTAEDLALANNPTQINTNSRTPTPLPSSGPTLKAKAFDGIRAKDLPFEVSSNENLAGAAVVPIAVGKTSAKNTINYASPSLSENKNRQSGIKPLTGMSGGGSASELAALGAATPSSIQLSGAGGTGNAPTGARTGAVLANRSGGGSGGLVNRGTGRGSGIGSGIEGVPSASRQLETESVGTGAARTKQTQKGFQLEGPLGNRGIVKKVIPQYPAWAEEQGIVGSVQLYFTVTPDGSVRPSIQVRKTTGYPNLDQLGIDALKQWKFAPLNTPDEGNGQWGLITFNFSLAS
jgi:TonB family protein